VPLALFPTIALQGRPLDSTLLFVALGLISFGCVMVLSASIDMAAHTYGDPWYFFKRHLAYVAIACAAGVVVFSIPLEHWERQGRWALLLGLVLLILVLLPGVGKMVNGSRRWIGVGPFTLQASELAKFCFVVFFSSFLARRGDSFRQGWADFFKLLAIIAAFVGLLLLEPDFGSSVVLCMTAGAMMFVAGVPLLRFMALGLLGVVGLAFMAITSPYRWQRLITFLDPWADEFSSGYQLVQSLIAFGRGEWFGLGLGNSLQKLFFLPEAHTDFIFSIVAEEFGLIGALVLVLGFAVLVWRMLMLARQARAQTKPFAGLLAIGVAFLISAQAFINMGVASGLLPTKGLTLPFVSAGGSSLLVSTAFVALMLRVSWELGYDRR
jgi:cell division protein FtsW